MSTQSRQFGSIHVILTVILAVALVGSLGFIFYQNFVAKKAASNNSTNQQSSRTDTTGNGIPGATVKAVAKKEYCTGFEKLCFNYPEDWSVSATNEMGSLSETAPSMDQVQIKNKTSETYLYMTTGISGIGGTCDPSENVDATILETYTTGVQGSYLTMGAPDYAASTLYAVKYVERVNSDRSKYTIGMYNLNEKAALKPGTVNDCSLGYRMFVSKFEKGEIKFGTSGFGVDSPQRSFESYEEAVNFLNSDDAKTAYEILKSAHYN